MPSGTNAQIRFTCPAGQAIRASDEWQKIMAHAATKAVKEVTFNARDAARNAIARSGFGSQWEKSIVGSMHPKRGEALNPWGWVHSTLNFADVFELGTISIGRPLMWLPLPNVPAYPGTGSGKFPPRQMTPKIYVEMVGPLTTIKRPGKPPMLGAVVAVSRSGKITTPARGGLFNRSKFQGRAKGQAHKIIPMFIGVPTAVIKKRFDVKPAIEKEASKLFDIYAEGIREAQI